MLITTSPAGRGRVHARLGNRLLCTTDTPLTSCARILLREGVPPSTVIEIAREGSDRWDMRSTIGRAAALTVIENERVGPVFRPYRAFPSRVASRPSNATNQQELSACA